MPARLPGGEARFDCENILTLANSEQASFIFTNVEFASVNLTTWDNKELLLNFRDLGVTTYVNGVPTNPVQLDTTQAATDIIDYVASDQNGLASTTTRTLIIQAANDNQATTTPANDNTPPLAATGTAATSSVQ